MGKPDPVPDVGDNHRDHRVISFIVFREQPVRKYNNRPVEC